MRFLFFVLLCVFPFVLLAQKTIKGLVLDGEKNTPVPKASVFLNNTSMGTTANDEGRFQLTVPAGRYELIVSSIGYATQNISLAAANADESITVRLLPRAPDLEEVIIEPYEKDGWKKWGQWFNENFLGQSDFGRESRIKNPEVLKFRHSKKRNELTVVAIAPLVIENRGLGYRVTYQLENFSYNFRSRYLFYGGYPFFENLPGGDRKKRRWEKARVEAYTGSMLQFMRALYRNRIGEEGFAVRYLQKLPNTEKKRVQRLFYNRSSAGGDSRVAAPSNDSMDYYNSVLRQDDERSVVGAALLPGDSIAYALDSVTAGFYFPHYLHITYQPARAAKEYSQQFPQSRGAMVSEITLLQKTPLEVQANGAFFDPQGLLSTGWWAWSEKLGRLLPYDYWPETHKGK